MKVKDIANRFGINREEFENYLKQADIEYKSGLSGMIIDDLFEPSELVADFKQYQNEKAKEAAEKQAALERAAAEEQARIERAAAEKRDALANMLITSGFSFDGYTITKYSGYISGDDAIQVGRGTAGFFTNATNVGESLMASLVQIRRNAIAELKEAAYALGCNAVIGVDFDYLTLDPVTASSTGGTVYLPYVFGVTANGNAVIIERNQR